MVADTEGARRWTSWAAYRRQPGWAGLLANAALILAVASVGAHRCISAQVISGANVAAAAIMIVAFAAIFGVAAGGARWMHAALAGRVDLLSQALDASPDPQLILAAGRPDRLRQHRLSRSFPAIRRAALTRLAAALADPESQRRFRAAAQPGRGRGPRHRGAAAARCARRRRRLVQHRGQPDRRPARLQLLEHPGHHRPPRDGGGDPRRAQQARRISRRRADRLLFGRWRRAVSVRQPDAGEMARRQRRGDRRQRCAAARFPRRPPPPDDRAVRPVRRQRRRRASAARSRCKSRDGRTIQAWIGQSTVGERRRSAHPHGGARPDPGARMGIGAAAVARALPAVFRQRPGRHRADRPVRPAGGGEPRAWASCSARRSRT